MIQTTNLTKKYGSILALDEVSITVEANTIFALLGQNGAGKTTLVKSLLNLIRIDNGSITINGKKPQDEASRKELAYLPEKFNFFPYYSVKATLEFYAKARGIPKSRIQNEITDSMKKLTIENLAKRKLSTLSKGQLQRVGIATTLIGEPTLLVWDEPFTGLDPIGIRDIKALIKEEATKGKTFFINSHILSEIEQVCNHMAILNEGKCLAQGSINELKQDSTLEDFFCNTVRN